MNVQSYTNAQEFYDAAGAFLLQDEAENNLIIGLAQRLIDDGPHAYSTDDPRFMTISDVSEICAALLQTPPYNATITAAPREAVTALVTTLHTSGIPLPGYWGQPRQRQISWRTGRNAPGKPRRSISTCVFTD